MKCEKYDCGKVIGEGAYSQVRIATDTTTDKQCALKILKLNCDECKDALNEAKIMKDIAHPNIVGMLEYAEEAKLVKENRTKKCSYVAYELAEKGSMFDYVAHTSSFSESNARYFFSQILDAIEYLHFNGISHRDIKCENVVLDSSFNPKLCDFGFATKNVNCNTFKGTEAYMAPEIHQKNGYNGKSIDIFALGVMLFAMVIGKLPFVSASPNDCRYKLIGMNKVDLFWRSALRGVNSASKLSDEFKELVVMMISPSAVDRPSISEIRQSDWFDQKLISNQDIIKEFGAREEVLKKKQDDEFCFNE